jgi:hypothetical protein
LAIVGLQEEKTRGKYHTLHDSTPKRYVEALGWKAGDRFVVEFCERNRRRELFIYKL